MSESVGVGDHLSGPEFRDGHLPNSKK